MRALFILTSSAVAAWTIGAAAVQESRPSQEQATFRSAVELVSVDVSVLDRNGRPLEGLRASDFALAVDGRPRRVASAEFVRLTPSSTPPPAPTHYSSNAHGGAGQLIALVVDQANISTGRARGAAESAIRFLKRLSPMDRVALFSIPGPGPRIGFTLNHALVQSQLARITGHATTALGPNRLGLGEAARIDRGDQMALNTVADRECTNAERLICMQELGAEAGELVGEARDRARNSLGALRALLEQFAESNVPKTVVLLSEALVVDQDRPGLEWLGPLAGRGRVALHVLRIDLPGADASAPRRSFNRGEDVAVAEEGLSLLASLTRGSLHRVAGNADNIFARLSLEMSGYYLLGFEPELTDRDGKPHKITIDVPGRRGVDVRARQDFAVEQPRALTNEEALAETLGSPLLASDIGLKVTTYTFREQASGKLRILIAADIDRTNNQSGQLSLGYALVGPRGGIVASQFEQHVKAPIDTETLTQHFMAAAAADAAGIYGLKLAVVDEKGRRGSVEHAFRAQLADAGPIQSGDLLIGEDAGAGLGAAAAVDANFTDAETLHGYLELYGDSADALQKASVTVEVASREDSRALETVPARFDEGTSTASRKVAEAVLPVGLLPPGDYHARAIITIGGRKAGQVSRPFRVARSTPAASAAAPAVGRRAQSKPFSVRVDPFQRTAVLTPDVVGFFVQRMSTAERGALTPEAIDHARAGRFDAAADAAKASGHRLATAFLDGLTLYSRGHFDPAAERFREAIRIDSEFFPAAFYIGACYAANGRDRDASAAWQTSLLSETEAPFVYTLLADAFLRQRELDRAMDILNEATQRWPDDGEVQMRLAAALAMSGKSAEALRVLDTYLAHYPTDTERLFLALRLIYEAQAAGRAIGATPEENRARFARYAAAYAEAKGPQAALVEQWKKFMDRRQF